MKAWHSSKTSGTVALSEAASMTEVLDMTGPPEGFAGRLRALRKQKDISQTELGLRAGLHYTHIGRFERGASRPGGDTARRLTDALDVTNDYLLEGAPDDAARAKVADRELPRQFQAAERLSDEGKPVIKTLLDAFLTRRLLRTLVR
jgi:transcriptional regulator with XRE-family HTH domain